MKAFTEPEFIAEFGNRADTAAKRKALSKNQVPEGLKPALERSIEASGVTLEQTKAGWVGKSVFQAVKTTLEAERKGKKGR